MGSDTGRLAGGWAIQAEVALGKFSRGGFFVIEPDTPQELCRIKLSAGSCAGSVLAQGIMSDRWIVRSKSMVIPPVIPFMILALPDLRQNAPTDFRF